MWRRPTQEGHGAIGEGPEESHKDIRGLEHLSYDDKLRAGALQPREEKASEGPYRSLSVPEGDLQETEEGLFIRAGSNRTRRNGLKLKDGRIRYQEEIPYFEDGETLEHIAQQGCECPLPGGIQYQAEWGCEHPGLVGGPCLQQGDEATSS